MSRSASFALLLVPLAAACQSQRVAEPQAGASPPALVALEQTALHAEADALELWRSADFRRRLAESYVAETEIEPKLLADERKTMQEVLELIGAQKFDAAIALLTKSCNPASSAVFDFTLANLHFQQDRLEPAARSYVIAVGKYPKFRRAWKNLALIHVRLGDFATALPELTRVIELGGGDSVSFGLMGFAHSSLENHLAAESAYRMAILMDPVTRDWQLGLARSFFKQQRFADASALCENMLAKDPARAELWLLQANAYIGMAKPREAAMNFELAESLGAATTDSRNMLGDIYVNEELYDLAVASFSRALELDPKASPERAIRAAKVLSARGATTQTAELIRRIETLRADQIEASTRKDLLKLRARIAVAQGAGDEEARVLEEIVTLDPLDGEALILLGQHSARAGDAEQAVFYYERAAGLEAFEADAKVRHAQLLVGQGKYALALPLLRRAQTLKPRENIQQYLEQVERVSQGR